MHNPKQPEGAHNATLETHQEILRQLQSLREEVTFLKAANENTLWFTRAQAMRFLSLGSTKLWELAKAGTITTSDKLYNVLSCKRYLVERSYSTEIILERLNTALLSKKK